MGNPFVLVSLHNNIDPSKAANNTDEYLRPRQDYIEIVNRLGGELFGRQIRNQAWYRFIKPLERKLKLDLALSVFVAVKTKNDQVVLSASEKVAIPLAVWLAFRRNRPRHVVIGHKLSSGAKANLLQKLPVQRYFDAVICLCRSQAKYAVNVMKIPAERVHFIYDKVDEVFFRPESGEQSEYILAVGQEQRDYPTLIQAMKGLKQKLIIVASSPWSNYRSDIQVQENVTVLKNLSFVELRQLYNAARLVVVPLAPADYAAGANGVLEAMSMGKPLIVTKTEGIEDYIRDGETGCFVAPGDVDDLREKILYFSSNSSYAREIGAQARQVVENEMNMDRYVEAVSQIVLSMMN